jgi:replicative DNA helicase
MNGSKTKDSIIEKVPPQSLEAERAVLGSMLIEESAISMAIELLKDGDFYNSANSKIYNVICDLFSNNKPVDVLIVTEALRKQGLLEKVGGPAYLSSLASEVPTAANVEHYARIVKEKSVLRKLINVSTQIASDGYSDENENVDELLDKAEKLIFDITSHKVETSFISLKDIIKDSIETIDKLYQNKTHVTGLATSLTDFDVMTAGLQKSDLVVVAGRPSMGKTSLALRMLENAAVKNGIPVAIFSLEMSKEQLVQRLLCSHARVDIQKVRTGYLSEKNEWPKLTSAASILAEAPIYIDDTPGISALELRAKARRLKSQHKIELIMVDYLQLMQGSSRSDSRQQEISDISRSLKALARELSVPVIAVSQLSRAVESRTDRRPQLSDLRESGAIEQDADVVVLLLREEYYSPSPENKGRAEVIIAKQRNGPVGNFFLTFLKEYARFENYTESEAM